MQRCGVNVAYLQPSPSTAVICSECAAPLAHAAGESIFAAERVAMRFVPNLPWPVLF